MKPSYRWNGRRWRMVGPHPGFAYSDHMEWMHYGCYWVLR